MISQQWVDPFQGDVCPPPVTYFHLFLCALCLCHLSTTRPHLTDVTRVRTSPRCSTLHDFSDQGATPSPSETPIHDVARHQISWLSFLLDRRFRLNHDLVTRGFEACKELRLPTHDTRIHEMIQISATCPPKWTVLMLLGLYESSSFCCYEV
jgi:hypothetical protein